MTDGEREYNALTTLFQTAVLDRVFMQWERYRDLQLAESRTWMGFTEFVNKIMVHGAIAYEALLADAEKQFKS